MKKVFVILLTATIALSSCSFYGSATERGAFTGSYLGSLFGSSIGAVIGGHSGMHIGDALGTTTGLIAGAAIGASVDSKREKERNSHYNTAMATKEREAAREQNYDNTEVQTAQNGDDRIDFTPSDGYVAKTIANNPLKIHNLRYEDEDGDGKLRIGETGKIVFEVLNGSDEAALNIRPIVEDAERTRYVEVSPGVNIERIAPGRGIRYTAMVRANRKVKPGTIVFRAYAYNGETIVSDTKTVNVTVIKK